MIDGLAVIEIKTSKGQGNLLRVEARLEGEITIEELESLEYCKSNDYDFALYAVKV